MMKFRMLVLVVSVLAAGLGGVAGAFGAEDPIAARKQVFKGFKGVMETTKAILEANQPVGAVVPEAQKVVSGAAALKGMFPAGSDQGDTKALPDIWRTADDFAAKMNAMELAAQALADAAGTGDAAATGAKFKAMAGTCKSCHESYKAK